MNNIALVSPSTRNYKSVYKEYPLGIGYIGTILKQNGYNVKIFDQPSEGWDNMGLIDNLKKFNPDLIGFSTISSTYNNTINLINLIKHTNMKECPIIGGGIHVTMFPEDSLNNGFDVIIKGEGESKILSVVKNIYNKKYLKNIPGIAIKDEKGIIINNNDIITNINLNELPIVDRSLYNMDLYTHHSIVAARGCYYRCKFCCNYSGTLLNDGVSIRSIDSVIKEIEYLITHFDAKDIFFVDDIFFLKKQQIIEFCNGVVKRKLHFKWYVQLRVDYVDNEIAEALKKANCTRVYFGVESGSDTILKNANKGITREKIKRSIECLKNVGIRVKTGWIYGLPGSIDEQRKSISLMVESMPNDISIHKLIPFPGTEYYNKSEEYGININKKGDFSEYSFSGLNDSISFEYMTNEEYIGLLQETEVELRKVGYISSDESLGGEKYIFTTPLNKKHINILNDKKENLYE